MKVQILRAAAVVAALFATTTTADAGSFIPGFSGNVIMNSPNSGNNPSGDGIVNFAVFDNTTGPSFSTLFPGAASFFNSIVGSNANALNASYLYFYQIVNSNPQNPESTLSNFYLPLTPNQYVAAGDLRSGASGVLFTELKAAVTTTVGPGAGTVPGSYLANGNPQLGLETPVVLGNTSPVTTGATPNGFVTNAAAVLLNTTSPIDTGAFFPPIGPTAGAPAINFNTNTIPRGGFSTILFIASNNAPVLGTGSIQDGLPNYGGLPVPLATPEPATLAMVAIGIPALGFARRLRKGKAVVA